MDEYYQQLTQATIDRDVEIMKVATPYELYELISTDCRHYVSIIKNYQNENLQTLCNMSIRLIEGHLLVKFRLNATDQWNEVGFLDNRNTEQETLEELSRRIKYILKHSDEINRERREQIVNQMRDTDTNMVKKNRIEKKPVPDDYFSSSQNPELTISTRQKESAGYQISSKEREPIASTSTVSPTPSTSAPTQTQTQPSTSTSMPLPLPSESISTMTSASGELAILIQTPSQFRDRMEAHLKKQREICEILIGFKKMLHESPKRVGFQLLRDYITQQDVGDLIDILLEWAPTG